MLGRIPDSRGLAAPRLAGAIVLAGGRGRRLGGVDKPALRTGGRSLLQIALAAVAGPPVVVVGPDRPVPPGVLLTRETPAGAGPAAAIVAGLAALNGAAGWSEPAGRPADAPIAVLAADLTAVDRAAVAGLCAAVADRGDRRGADGAVLLDAAGHRQWLIGVWRLGPLIDATGSRADWSGRSVRELLEPLHPVEVGGHEAATADVDTPDDWPSSQWADPDSGNLDGQPGKAARDGQH